MSLLPLPGLAPGFHGDQAVSFCLPREMSSVWGGAAKCLSEKSMLKLGLHVFVADLCMDLRVYHGAGDGCHLTPWHPAEAWRTLRLQVTGNLTHTGFRNKREWTDFRHGWIQVLIEKSGINCHLSAQLSPISYSQARLPLHGVKMCLEDRDIYISYQLCNAGQRNNPLFPVA